MDPLRREIELEIASLSEIPLQVNSRRVAARLQAMLDRHKPRPPVRRDLVGYFGLLLVFVFGLGVSYTLARAGEPQSAWLWSWVL